MSSESPSGAQPGAPLLVAEALQIQDQNAAQVASLTLEGRLEVHASSLVLVGDAQRLLWPFLRPATLRLGTLEVLGQAPVELLRSGSAGYAPKTLPAPPDYTLADTLLLGGRLLGLRKPDVLRALSSCDIGGLQKKKLGELSPLQMRLAGLAHARLSAPTLYLLEDLFDGLDDAESEILEATVEESLSLPGVRSISACTVDSVWSRRVLARTPEALICRGDVLLGPVAAKDLGSQGLWVRTARSVQALLPELQGRGGRVTKTPHAQVIFVQGLTGLQVVDSARAVDVALLELSPTEALLGAKKAILPSIS